VYYCIAEVYKISLAGKTDLRPFLYEVECDGILAIDLEYTKSYSVCKITFSIILFVNK